MNLKEYVLATLTAEELEGLELSYKAFQAEYSRWMEFMDLLLEDPKLETEGRHMALVAARKTVIDLLPNISGIALSINSYEWFDILEWSMTNVLSRNKNKSVLDANIIKYKPSDVGVSFWTDYPKNVTIK